MHSDRRVFLIGPTASGKSELAIRIAERIDGEIISADARQCYRGMELGSAAPEPSLLARIPHHNVSIFDPSESDNAATFAKRSALWIDEIQSKGKIPVIVGGSTLYLQALLQPFDPMPAANAENTRQLQEEAEEKGVEALYSRLEQVDPEYAQKMDGPNRQRIIRALDVWMQTGQPFSFYHQTSVSKMAPAPKPGDLWIGLKWPREQLVKRIEKRAKKLFEGPFKEEVENLKAFPELLESTVGFKQMHFVLKGESTLEEALEQTIIATRQYAKRQMTWFRRWPFITWFHPEDEENELLEWVAAEVKNPYI